MVNDISYSSIAEIHNALLRREYSARELFDYIKRNYDDYKVGTIKDRISGSEDDYHNLSVEFCQHNCTPFAEAIAIMGVEVYPMSTNLLADAIKYSQLIGDSQGCQTGLGLLDNIDRKYWNWRTFVFVIDFLKNSLSSVSNIEEYEKNLNEAKKYIAEFRNYIPHEERSFVAEAELYEKQNKHAEMIEALKKGISTVRVAPQCCMKLANAYLELGEYEKVYEYAQKGLLAATQDQPTVSIGYLYYLSALAMDAGRIKARQEGKHIDENNIKSILFAYQTADKLFINEGRTDVPYRNTISAKLIMLKMEEGLLKESDLPHSAEIENNLNDDSTGIQQFLEMVKKNRD